MAVYGLWQSANAAPAMLAAQAIFERAARTDRGNENNDGASSGASQRLDDLFFIAASSRPA